MSKPCDPYESEPGIRNALAFDEAHLFETEVNIPRFMALLPEIVKGPILDFGCGDGRFTQLLAKKYSGVPIVGVDKSRLMLPGNSISENVEYGIWDGMSEVDPNEGFQLITAKLVFHYLTEAELDTVGTNLVDLLGVGGRLALSVPHPALPPDLRLLRPNATTYDMFVPVEREVGNTGITAYMWHRNLSYYLEMFKSVLPDNYEWFTDEPYSGRGSNTKMKRMNIVFMPRSNEIFDVYTRLERLKRA